MSRVLIHALVTMLLLSGLVEAQEQRQADTIRTATLVVDGIEHPIRIRGQEDDVYVSLEDLAVAIGGAWGRDPLSRAPLLTVGSDRVLFSTTDRRISVNNRRRRLSRAVEVRGSAVWVPVDFIEDHLDKLIDRRVKLRATPPRLPAGNEAAEPADAPPRRGPAVAGPRASPEQRQPFRRNREGDPLLGPREALPAVLTIVLDPGHGGDEDGAEGPTGLLEKDVVLEVSRRLRLHLQQRGHDVHITRNRDVNVPLEERTAMANNRQADLFISLHANASTGRSARGAETYFLSLDRAVEASQETEPAGVYVSAREREDPLQMILWDMAQSGWLARSGRLAEIIQDDFNRVLDIPDRGVKQAPFRVLVGATMPAVLVEIGFISNPDEEERLRDPDFLDIIVSSLTRSIDTYGRESRGQMPEADESPPRGRPRRGRP